MADPVTLRFRYTEQDYVRAMRLHLSKRMRLKLDIVVAVALGLLSAFMLWDRDNLDWFWVFGGVASAVLLAIVLLAWFVAPVRAYRQEPKLHDEYFLQFGSDGIAFRTASIDSRIEWKLYRELRSDEHTHLLVYGTNGFTALPRRVFTGPDQEAAFLQLVRQSIILPGTPGSPRAPSASQV